MCISEACECSVGYTESMGRYLLAKTARHFVKIGGIVLVGLILALHGGAGVKKPAARALPHGREAAAVVSADISGKRGATVTRVIDGDTIDVRTEAGESVRVRLLGVNTPETVDPRKPVECFGKEASAFTKSALEGTTVTLETDPTQDTYDKYGRLLAYVFLANGTDFNQELVANGYAHEYTYRVPYRFQTEFKAAERESRETGRGLWNHATCL